MTIRRQSKKFNMENVIIIGGGPAGLSAAIYLARAGLKPLVFAGSPPGGQLTLTSEVENFPGYESILGAELIEKMRNQAIKFGAIIKDENVTSVKFSESNKSVNVLKTKSVIIATGAKALWLGVPGEEKLRGKGVSACATCDGFFFREKTVVIVGGGDTALEEALTLTKFAKKVYIIHRRDSFRASKIMTERVLNHPKIEVVWNSQVVEIMGEKKVEGIKLKSSTDSVATYRTLLIDGIFVAIGHRPDTELFKGKVEMDEKGYILTFNQLAEAVLKGRIVLSKEKINHLKSTDKHFNSSTNIEGIFAAGDCVDHVYRQASTASGMGVGAALDVERWLER